MKSILRPLSLVAVLLGTVVPLSSAASPVVVHIAGSGPVAYDNGLFQGEGSPAVDAFLNAPTGLASTPDGRLFIADYWNDRIRQIDTSGAISTFGGDGWPGNQGNGTALGTSLWGPWGVAMRGTSVVFTDTFNSSIRAIHPDGSLTRIAGVISGTPGSQGDPYGGWSGFSGDGGAATSARLDWPLGICADGAGNVYVADSWNHRIRRISASGTITTVAGNGWSDPYGRGRFAGDGGPATQASLNWPTAVAVDTDGNLFIADTYNHRVRRVDAVSRTIATVVGNGEAGDAGDGGPGFDARLNHPSGLAIGQDGTLFVADTMNHRVRALSGGTMLGVAGSGQRGLAGDTGPASAALFNEPRGLAISPAGDLLVADTGNSRIRMVMFGETLPLSGFVRDANTMEAIPGAVVSWNGIQVTSDAGGKYVLPVYMGTQTVAARKPSYGAVADAITVGPDTMTHDFLLPSGFLRVRVVDDGGHIVAGADVVGEANRGVTGPDGAVTLRFPPGAQSLSVTRDGYAPSTSTTVNVAAGQTLDIVLTLYRTESIILSLPYNRDWISSHTNPGDYTEPTRDFAFAAEELPLANSLFSLAAPTGQVDFRFPNTADGANNALLVNGQIITVPAGRYTAVHFLEAARFGSASGNAVVRYADGGSASVPVLFSDWAWNAIGQSLGPLESVAIVCSHRHSSTDASAGPPVDILQMRLPVDPSRTLTSIELPADGSGANSRDAYLFAATLEAIGGPAYGDVDASGAISAADARLALMAAAGLSPLDLLAARRADVSPVHADGAFGDGSVQMDDVAAILQSALR